MKTHYLNQYWFTIKKTWRPISNDKFSLHIRKLSWNGIKFYGNSIKIPKFYPRKHPSNYCSKFCCGWEKSQITPFMNIVKRNVIQNQDILTYMFVPNTPWSLHVVGVCDLTAYLGHWTGSTYSYKPCNHNLYIEIVILPHIDNTQNYRLRLTLRKI